MRPLTVIALLTLIVGALLGLGELAAPSCANFAGTARDSGYPCRIDRSSGASDYVLSRTRTISVPFAGALGVILIVAGGCGIVASRQRP